MSSGANQEPRLSI